MNSGRLWEVRMRAWGRLWRVRMVINRIRCWFVGHNERSGGYWVGSNYCDRCFVDCLGDTTTLPDLLQRGYSWLVEREWAWFDKLDLWLCENYRLPHWWTY